MFGICISKLNLLFFLFVYSYAAQQAVEALHFAGYNKAKYILELFFRFQTCHLQACVSLFYFLTVFTEYVKEVT